jgi:hypothetical protein
LPLAWDTAEVIDMNSMFSGRMQRCMNNADCFANGRYFPCHSQPRLCL